MLILLGGLPGSGRKDLASRLAKAHTIHHYNTDRHRVQNRVRAQNGNFQEHIIQPQSDLERLLIFQRVAQDIPLVSKMYDNVIIDAGFHRSKPRQYLFSEAKQYFDPIVFIWIDSSDNDALERIKKIARKGLVPSVEAAVQDRERNKQDFEPFKMPPPTFLNHGASAESVERLWALVQKVLHEGQTKSFSGL